MTNSRTLALFVAAHISALTLVCGTLAAQTPLQTAPLPAERRFAKPLPAALREAGDAGAAGNENSAGLRTARATADRSGLPEVVPSGRPVIGVALEGGGALGLAHIGVLQWLEDNHIPVDRIAGTSMGGLVGGFYAAGYSPAELKKMATGDLFRAVFTLSAPYTDASFRRREDGREMPQAIQVGLKGGPSLRNALLADAGLNEFLATTLNGYNRSELSYDSLPIPFRCVATDLNTLQPVVFDSGPMPQALRATIAIPGVFAPVMYHKDYLVDGAILDNLPTDIVKQDLHADVVIAVELTDADFSDSDVNSVAGILERAFDAGTARNERTARTLADVLIAADTAKFTTTDYNKAADLIAAGYAAAEKNRAKLQKYALDGDGWAAYLANRRKRERPKPSTLETVKTEGGDARAKEAVEKGLSKIKGKPIEPATILEALRPVEANGTYQAGFETFAPQVPSPADRMQATGPDTGVLVRLSSVRNGPPFLLIGPDVTAMNSNVTRSTLDLRLIDQNLGGFGSEFRADFRFGFLTQASGEYYRLLTHSGYYIQPHLGILRQPVYLWVNQVRVSERLSQQAGGGFDAGRTFNRNFQASLEWRAQVLRWHLVLGSDGTPNVSGAAQTAVAHVVYDNTETGLISPEGSRLEVSAGSLFNAVGSQNAPLIEAAAVKTFSVTPKDIFEIVSQGNTYLRRNVAEPLRFTLGGPLTLSASSIDEYRGTDDYLARAAYLHRVATLPTGLGQGLYLNLAYEAGEIWAPEQRATLRQDGLITVIGATPLGAITVGGAVGDAGRRKMFVSFGRLF